MHTSASVEHSSIVSAVVAAGRICFPLICSLLTDAFFYSRSLPVFFFRLSRAESNFSKCRWRPRGHALSMARQSSVGWACGWLVSAVFWLWIEKKLWFSGPFSKRKMKMRVHIRLGSTCNVFRVRGVIVRMPYLPLRKVRWANSICVSRSLHAPLNTDYIVSWEELAWVRHSSTWEEYLDKFKMPRNQMSWKTLEKSGLEPTAPNRLADRKYCALSTQPNPHLQK